MWIQRGAIAAATNESQLAGVVAQEVAHLARTGTADQLTERLVASGLLGLLGAVLGNGPSARTAQIGAQVLAGATCRSSAATTSGKRCIGAELVRRAGWDAHGLIEFMDDVRPTGGDTAVCR